VSSNGPARMGTAHRASTDADLQRYQQPHTTSITAVGEGTAAHCRQAHGRAQSTWAPRRDSSSSKRATGARRRYGPRDGNVPTWPGMSR
jgi:hypothetical protein